MPSIAKRWSLSLAAQGLLAIGVILLAAGLALTPGEVAADPLGDPPGNDGVCEHANSEQACRDDPQPDHGKDCESHGANTDGNEDHCEEVAEPPITSSPPPSSSTTEEEATEVDLQVEEAENASPAAAEVAEVLAAEDVPEVAALPFAGSGGNGENELSRWLPLTVLSLLVTAGGVGSAVLHRRRSP